MMALGGLVICLLLLIGALTASPHLPRLFRFEALHIIAGFFSFGAVFGKALHCVLSRRRRLGLLKTDSSQSRSLGEISLIAVCLAISALAFTYWKVVVPGLLYPPPQFLAAELQSPEKSTAVRRWANGIWSQRGMVDDRNTNQMYGFGEYRVVKAGEINGADPPDFLCQEAWCSSDVGWIIDENKQIVGVALSWGNMRGGFLVFPEGRPSAFRVDVDDESPAADIIVPHTIS